MGRRAELVLAIFFVSGFSGLIYESVWSHYVQLFLGHAAYGQALVLIVFIGGLAIGSWICARRASSIRNPLRAYALIEGAIGLLALVFHTVFVHAVDWAYAWLLPATCEPSSTFCASQWLLSALLLAPQSVLLGMTFPLVSSAVIRMTSENPGYNIASLYFLNSLGGVLGVLASAFVLIPRVGLPGTLITAGIANLAIALGAYSISREVPPALAVPRVAEPDADARSEQWIVRVLLATAALTGLSSFVYEISWIRMLSLVLGASTHSFELMLASFILGLALGGLWVRSRADAGAGSVRLLAHVQLLMGIFAVATVPLYNAAFDFMAWLLTALARTDGGFVLFNVSSTFISLMVMLPATFCAGMTLPLITYRLLRSSEGERALGAVYAANTFGSIAGVFVAVHLLMPTFGVGATLATGGAIDVLLGVALLAKRGARGLPRIPVVAVGGLLVFVAVWGMFSLDPARTASGVFRSGAARVSSADQILFHRDGKTATVDVLGNKSFRAIRTNGKTDAAVTIGHTAPTPDENTMAMLAVLPLGYRPDARTAAVIGFGSGTSTALLLASPNLARVDTVEIEPAIVEGARQFRPTVDAAYDDPRSHIVIDDAKSYFARGHKRYDIIVSEPSNPWVTGVSSLFTEEFYRRLALYLNDGGVLSQWMHVYEMDSETFASIVAAIEKTFPDFVIYQPNDGDVVIIARKGGAPGRFDPSVLKLPRLQPELTRLRLNDPEFFARHLIATASTMRPFFGSYNGTPNSDFFPIVDHRASKTRFTRARVEDFSNLEESAWPMLEMLDGAFSPSTYPAQSQPVIASDLAGETAWSMYRGIVGEPPRQPPNENARLLGLWTTQCSADFDFAQVFSAMLRVAMVANPQLPAAEDSRIWNRLLQSRCMAGLDAGKRRWVQLFDAVGRRDASAMASVGSAILSTSKARSEGMEYALFAAATGLVCKGEDDTANKLLTESRGAWLRPGQWRTEMRYLGSILSSPQAARAAARCR